MNPRLEQNGSFILKEELERLKARAGIKTDFTVVWLPKADSKKEGEVVGNTIFVYSLDVDEALQTLRHEFVDFFIISSAIQAYLKLINVLLSTISEDAYKKKEEVVEMLLKLLVDDRPSS